MDKLGFDWCEQQSCAWLVLLDMLTFLRLLCVPPSCDGSLQLRQHMAFQLTLVIFFRSAYCVARTYSQTAQEQIQRQTALWQTVLSACSGSNQVRSVPSSFDGGWTISL